MNLQISRRMTDDHIAELRRQAAQSSTGTHRDRSRSRAPRLRRRIGLAMIDTGTRMLAATQTVTTD